VAGALVGTEEHQHLVGAGLEGIEREVTRVYGPEQAVRSCCGGELTAELEGAGGRVVSAFVRACQPDAS
jgi:hypothetical protein